MKTRAELDKCISDFREKHNVDPLIDGMNGGSMTCPNCGAKECVALPEDMPEEKKKSYGLGMFWCIRAFKVDDYSHCIVCDQWFR